MNSLDNVTSDEVSSNAHGKSAKEWALNKKVRQMERNKKRNSKQEQKMAHWAKTN